MATGLTRAAARAGKVGAEVSAFGNPYVDFQVDRGSTTKDVQALAYLYMPVDAFGQRGARIEEADALVRWKGLSLPFTVFDKDQRVTHAAIVENKRLGEVLAFIKSQLDQRQPPQLKTNSERIGYRKKGRTSPGRKSFVDRMAERRRAEQPAAASG